MKKSNLIKVGDAISQILKEEKLDIKLSRFSVRKNWEEIAGKLVANHTTQIRFDEAGTMFLSFDSPALKNELIYNLEKLLIKVNQYCGYALIKKIVIN